MPTRYDIYAGAVGVGVHLGEERRFVLSPNQHSQPDIAKPPEPTRTAAIPTPRPGPAVVGTANLMPWTVPGGVPYAMGKFSVIIPTRTSTGDFDEMCLLAGAESSPLIRSVKPAAQIVTDMAAEAAAILSGR